VSASLRNVLILTYHFPPSSASGSFRLLGFARHLPKHGWRATVVAPPTLPWEPVDHALLEKLPAETRVYPAPYLSSRVVRKLVPVSGWLPRAWRACRRAVAEQRPEALLTSGPPHQVHWLGLWLKRRYGLPWVADFRDPWYPEGRTDRGRDLASWRVALQERAVVHAADAVVANAPGAARLLRRAYPGLRSKVVTLPNGYDREAFDGFERPVPPAGRRPRVVHAGAIYAGRDPRPFLDAVRALGADGRLAPEAAFFGPPSEAGLNLADEVRRRGLADRIEVHGQVPYARCLREMAAADILLLMDSPGRTVGVPAKLYEYLGAGRPVLALGEPEGDLAWVLRQSGVPYRIAPPGDATAVATALLDLAGALRASAGRAAADLHRFSREAIAGRLAALLGRCAAGDGEGQGGEPGPSGSDDEPAEPEHLTDPDAHPAGVRVGGVLTCRPWATGRSPGSSWRTWSRRWRSAAWSGSSWSSPGTPTGGGSRCGS
jgi:glycosyltransferase involved in cell wall biosynthesis